MHSDRGCQYASETHSTLLSEHGFLASMSRKGNCWDNAVMERFFLNLKMERVWQRSYANSMEAIQDITDYIVGFYNTERLHSTWANNLPETLSNNFRRQPDIPNSLSACPRLLDREKFLFRSLLLRNARVKGARSVLP